MEKFDFELILGNIEIIYRKYQNLTFNFFISKNYFKNYIKIRNLMKKFIKNM